MYWILSFFNLFAATFCLIVGLHTTAPRFEDFRQKPPIALGATFSVLVSANIVLSVYNAARAFGWTP